MQLSFPYSLRPQVGLLAAIVFLNALPSNPVGETVDGILYHLLRQIGITELNSMQAMAVPLVQAGLDVIVVAPTGSGKTEAALLPVLASLNKSDSQGIRALYVTPLRALNRNMVERVQRVVAQTKLTVGVRHGDTVQSERRRQAATPPDLLITGNSAWQGHATSSEEHPPCHCG